MEDVIEKAIKGGWNNVLPLNMLTSINKDTHVANMVSIVWRPEDNPQKKLYSEIVIDPLFWISLGKACEWNSKCFELKKHEIYDTGFLKGCTVCNALRFHEINLIEGLDKAVVYLQELVK